MNPKALQTQGSGLVALIAIVAGAAEAIFDGNPATNPDWNIVIPMIITAIGVACSRAKHQSSEEANAKPAAPSLPAPPAS